MRTASLTSDSLAMAIRFHQKLRPCLNIFADAAQASKRKRGVKEGETRITAIRRLQTASALAICKFWVRLRLAT